MSLLSLPNELILEIAEHLEDSQLRDLYSLLRVSRHIYQLLAPTLHRLATSEKYAMNALCWSAAAGNERMVRYLIDHGAGTIVVTDAAEDEETRELPEPNKGTEALIRLVLEKGANLIVSPFASRESEHLRVAPALHQALFKNYKFLARLLLKNGADVLTRSFGYSALHYAAYTRDETVIVNLLKNGADITARNAQRMTPLHWAAIHGDETVLRLLLEYGADTRSMDMYGRTTISTLTRGFTLVPRKTRSEDSDNSDELEPLEIRLRKVRLMLGKGNIAYKDQVGNTGLHRAAFFGDEALAKVLLERGIDITARGPDEQTALHLAVISGSAAVVRGMVENYGADIAIQDKYGNTPLHLAIQYKRKGVLRFLVWKGANVNLPDKYGRTAMHWAAGMGDAVTVKLLLSKGADYTARDDDGRTPLFLAAQPGHTAVVKMLMDHGADITTEDNYGETVPESVLEEVLNHPERCVLGSPSIFLGRWPPRQKYWGVWYNISERLAGKGSRKVLCNPGQHVFKVNTSLTSRSHAENDTIFWGIECLFE